MIRVGLGWVLTMWCLSVGVGYAAEAFRDCPDCPEMVAIPAGVFTMGSSDAGPDRRREEGPAHRVTIGRSFAMSKYELTWNEWEACVGAGRCAPGGDEGFGRGRRPVINISLDEAMVYAAWLSEKTGKAYRLPSEAEWEYAARAGSDAPAYWGEGSACAHANVFNASVRERKKWKWYWDGFLCEDGYYAESSPVGQFRPNAFGLHDMLGNVREWTLDCFNGDYAGAPADGRPWLVEPCRYHVTRGGSWVTEPVYIRAAGRYWVERSNRNDDLGIRLVRALP